MHKASCALASGADFRLISPVRIQIESTLPVLAVCGSFLRSIVLLDLGCRSACIHTCIHDSCPNRVRKKSGSLIVNSVAPADCKDDDAP